MKVLLNKGPGKKSWEEEPNAVITEATDVVVEMIATTLRGTDLHTVKGDVPEVEEGRISGTRVSSSSPRSVAASPDWPMATASAFRA